MERVADSFAACSRVATEDSCFGGKLLCDAHCLASQKSGLLVSHYLEINIKKIGLAMCFSGRMESGGNFGGLCISSLKLCTSVNETIP